MNQAMLAPTGDPDQTEQELFEITEQLIDAGSADAATCRAGIGTAMALALTAQAALIEDAAKAGDDDASSPAWFATVLIMRETVCLLAFLKAWPQPLLAQDELFAIATMLILDVIKLRRVAIHLDRGDQP